VAAISATRVETIGLKPVTRKHNSCDLHSKVTDSDGRVISHYHRRLRCVPKELLSSEVREHVVDSFN